MSKNRNTRYILEIFLKKLYTLHQGTEGVTISLSLLITQASSTSSNIPFLYLSPSEPSSMAGTDPTKCQNGLLLMLGGQGREEFEEYIL